MSRTLLYEEGARGPQDDARLKGVHSFERAGLGKAPFRCIGCEVRKYQPCHGAPVQPGGSCQFCGEGIVYCYVIRSADGREFIVGSDCVARTGDAGLVDQIKRSPERREIERKKRYAKHQAVRAEVDALLADAAVRTKLGPSLPTIVNSVRYSGMAGYARNLKRIRELIA